MGPTCSTEPTGVLSAMQLAAAGHKADGRFDLARGQLGVVRLIREIAHVQRVGGDGESELLSRLVTLASHGAEYVPLVARLINKIQHTGTVYRTHSRAATSTIHRDDRMFVRTVSMMLTAAGFAKEAYGILGSVPHGDRLGNIAALAGVGRHREALDLSLQLRDDLIATEGRNSPQVLGCMNNIASSYSALGQHASALPLFEECLEAKAQVVGTSHPSYLSCLQNLATCLFSLSRYEDATK